MLNSGLNQLLELLVNDVRPRSLLVIIIIQL